jgi:pilus assembly protein CpaB
MERNKAIIIVAIIAVVLAGIAAWQVSEYLKKNKPEQSIQTQNIIVAATELPTGSTIKDPAQIKTVGWPVSSLPPGSIQNSSQVVGRVTITNISAGEPITDGKLLPVGATSVMTYIIPAGHRAITVAVNEVAGVAGFLNPGNHVDVVLTVQPTGSQEPLSKIVLQNVPILAIGQIIQHKEDKPVIVPTVTVDLTPDDAEKLVIAASKGSLQMLLRNVTDTGVVEVKAVTIKNVLGSTVTAPVSGAEKKAVKKVAARKPVETPKPVEVKVPPSHTVEIIKGTTRRTEQMEENK